MRRTVRSMPSLSARNQRFAKDCRGVSAVEFALLLPVMVALYLGSVEVGNGLSAQFKATLAARTVADLASQYSQINNSTMTGILGATIAVMAPFSATGMVVIVSEVSTDSKGKATITWSDALNGTAHTVGSSVTLPANVNAPNISIVWGEVTYPYNPEFGYVLTGTVNIYQSMYFYPRLSTSVTRVSS
jgi:Flp pilus assembly protein TadG